MAKLPYGGFDAAEARRDYSAQPWEALREIQRYLIRGLPIPPMLARWLGEAIERCGNDPDAFLRLLGLAKWRGKPPRYPRDVWIEVGARMCELQDDGMTLSEAIARVTAEMPDIADADERTLRRWRDTYRRASEEMMRDASFDESESA